MSRVAPRKKDEFPRRLERTFFEKRPENLARDMFPGRRGDIWFALACAFLRRTRHYASDFISAPPFDYRDFHTSRAIACCADSPGYSRSSCRSGSFLPAGTNFRANDFDVFAKPHAGNAGGAAGQGDGLGHFRVQYEVKPRAGEQVDAVCECLYGAQVSTNRE